MIDDYIDGFLTEELKLVTQGGATLKRFPLFGVGKTIGNNVYIHKNYASELPMDIEQAREKIPSDFKYDIIKFNILNGSVSFISSPDFNESPEPMSGDSYHVNTKTGDITFTRHGSDPWIFHHKWLMVKDDYPFFDVYESYRRSRKWTRLPGIDYSRIGKRSFWRSSVLPLLHEKKTLLIDDERNIDADRVAKTYDEGIEALKERIWDVLYLDHDLGLGKTGYDIMNWLEEHPEHLPDRIIIISANPVGRRNMERVVRRLYKK